MRKDICAHSTGAGMARGGRVRSVLCGGWGVHSRPVAAVCRGRGQRGPEWRHGNVVLGCSVLGKVWEGLFVSESVVLEKGVWTEF